MTLWILDTDHVSLWNPIIHCIAIFRQTVECYFQYIGAELY
jgi:hypothetical protein